MVLQSSIRSIRLFRLVASATALVLLAGLFVMGFTGPAVATVQSPAPGPSLETTQNTTVNVTFWVAPSETGRNLTSLDALQSQRRNGSLTRTDTTALNDTLVVELRSRKLDEQLAAQVGANTTARYRNLSTVNRTRFDLILLNPGPEQPPKRIPLAGPGLRSVVADGRTDTYYLVLDPTKLRSRPYTQRTNNPPTRRITRGEVYGVNVTLAGDVVASAWRGNPAYDPARVKFVDHVAALSGTPHTTTQTVVSDETSVRETTTTRRTTASTPTTDPSVTTTRSAGQSGFGALSVLVVLVGLALTSDYLSR